ncbi:MAG: hypothetical protein Kow0062_19030 [Acidobacteriota bacterium]
MRGPIRRAVVACCIPVALLALSAADEPARVARGGGMTFQAVLSPAQGVPEPGGAITIERGAFRARVRPDLSAMDVVLLVEPSSPVLAAHLHCGRAGMTGPIPFGLINPGRLMFDGNVARGTLTNEDFTGSDCTDFIGRPVNNIAALAMAMRDGLIYVNVHTANNPPGEVRGQVLEED